MPINVVPVLEYDGELISQSKTIARFLAKEFGIAGKTNVQQAKADMIVDCVTDIEIGRFILELKRVQYDVKFKLLKLDINR